MDKIINYGIYEVEVFGGEQFVVMDSGGLTQMTEMLRHGVQPFGSPFVYNDKIMQGFAQYEGLKEDCEKQERRKQAILQSKKT